MGYLSCKAESATAVHTPSKKPTTIQKPNEIIQKPLKNKIQHFDYTDLQLATNNFSDQKLLGRGSHGLVYKAHLRNGRLVAVKKPSSHSHPDNEVDNEIDILSKLHSPHLVNLIGFSNNPQQNRLLVVEFMSNGTLYDTLHMNPEPPNWGRRIRLALHTAKAIETLHASVPPVIHRDIKSANILLDRNLNARLGDFGLALRCHVDDYRLLSTPPAGTMGYLDPGYVTPDNLSTKTDVFSFGILLLEIISGRKAIDVSHSPPSIVDWAIPLIRRGKLLSVFDPRIPPPKDPMVRKQLAVIAAKCVRSCRERRPSMGEIVESLSGLMRLVPVRSWNGLSNPCLMVETVGRPVEVGSSRPNHVGNGSVGGKQLSNPRRVYSDLGLRNNLMDLMARRVDDNKDNDDDENKVHRRSRFKKELDDDPSIGETSSIDSSRFYIVTRSKSCAQTKV
ncbi:putative protein kinase RLK-Pelle-CR4L family [Helianthus annuus]|nr:putative protein kinase RLK-Pelle-CR4L family [Helianthus annuus]